MRPTTIGRAALFAAIDLRNFNHEKYGDLPTDGRDPLDLIKALLKKGANPNLKTDTVPVHGLMQFDASWVNFDGETPFVRAALSGDIEVMRLLLENGADPNIATTQGTTALMAAAGINWIPGQTYSHSEAEYVEAVKLCLDRGADVNAHNSLGLTAMHGAANRGWESMIQILADHGAKLDVKDNAGRTPMIFAQGIFLAVRPPEAKPKAIALLKQLMAAHNDAASPMLGIVAVALGERVRATPQTPTRRRCSTNTASPATTRSSKPAAWNSTSSTSTTSPPTRKPGRKSYAKSAPA